MVEGPRVHWCIIKVFPPRFPRGHKMAFLFSLIIRCHFDRVALAPLHWGFGHPNLGINSHLGRPSKLVIKRPRSKIQYGKSKWTTASYDVKWSSAESTSKINATSTDQTPLVYSWWSQKVLKAIISKHYRTLQIRTLSSYIFVFGSELTGKKKKEHAAWFMKCKWQKIEQVEWKVAVGSKATKRELQGPNW